MFIEERNQIIMPWVFAPEMWMANHVLYLNLLKVESVPSKDPVVLYSTSFVSSFLVLFLTN